MLQVGVDCEDISRFKRLPFRSNTRFYERIFTPREIEYCISYRNPYPRFAARFAAKEATVKALNNIAKPLYTDIEIRKSSNNQPQIYIDRQRFKTIARLKMSLSVAHSDSHAVAFVVISDNRNEGKKVKQALMEKISCVKKIGRQENSLYTALSTK